MEVVTTTKQLKRKVDLALAELAVLRTKAENQTQQAFQQQQATNPVKMLERIASVEKEVPDVLKRCEEVEREKTRVVESVQRLLVANATLIKQLQLTRVHANHSAAHTDLQEFQQCCTEFMEDSVGVDPVYTPTAVVDAMQNAGTDHQEVPSPPDVDTVLQPTVPSQEHSAPACRTPSELGCTEVEDDDEETGVPSADFDALSVAVRGRCTKLQCDEVYDIVYNYYMSDGGGKRPTLSKSRLAALGAKVTGQTGQCKLNALRALGMIIVDRRGIRLNYQDAF